MPEKLCRVLSNKAFAESVLSSLKIVLAIDKCYEEVFPNGDNSKNEKLTKKIELFEKRVNREGGPTPYDRIYFQALREQLNKKKLSQYVFHDLLSQAELHKLLNPLKDINDVNSAKRYFKIDHELKLAETHSLVSTLGYLRDTNSFFWLIAKRTVVFNRAKKENSEVHKDFADYFTDKERKEIEQLHALLKSQENERDDEVKALLFDDIFGGLTDDVYKQQVEQARYAFATGRKCNSDIDKLKDIVLHAKPPLKKRIAHKLCKLCNCSSGRSRATPVSSVSEESESKRLTGEGKEEDSV